MVAGREELASLVGAIGELPPGQREALVQRELEGRSHEEIADRLGSTPGAVRGLIFRARLSLRDAAGFLVPLPLLRWLLTEGTASGPRSRAARPLPAARRQRRRRPPGAAGSRRRPAPPFVVASLALGSGVALRDEGRDAGAEASSGERTVRERR